MFSKKAIIGGGLGIIAASLGLKYLLFDRKKKLANRKLQRAVILDILGDLDREYNKIFRSIAEMVRRTTKNATPSEKREMQERFMSPDNPIYNLLKEAESAIYRKYGVTEEEFKFNCQEFYGTDAEIIMIQADIKSNYESAFKGKDPRLNLLRLPSYLDKTLTISLLESVLNKAGTKFEELVKSLRKKNVEIKGFDTPELIKGLKRLSIEEIRKEVISESRLSEFGNGAVAVFQTALQKYIKEDPTNFKPLIAQLEEKHQSRLNNALVRSYD
eukprot:TRINITY_DN716_c0_g2_i1.p1 TRINITY_DN716_c0_g2~~TRINITY_DN716_c0_g2_i1.p1  ORF type:complete len:272 (-),score=46.90 TRINITY_DN716_c0_g2_i1:54-869(-)